jgi:dTDP-4-dehydrorhamnose reductase
MIYVTGYDGNIGRALIRRGCFPLECDVTDFDAVEKAIKKAKPHLLFHLAALTDVNWCEKPENQDEALKVNFNGTTHITQVCDDVKVPFIFIGSDHIFSGGFGKYQEHDYKRARPMNWYGYTKFGAEVAVCTSKYGRVVRTSTLFSSETPMIKEYRKRLEDKEKIEVPTFIRRSFMYIEHFVDALLRYASIISKSPPIVHISGSKTVSWFEYMKEFAEVYDYDTKQVLPRRTNNTDYSPRNFNGGLNINLAKKLGLPCPSYKEGLRQMKEDGKA